MRNFLLKIVSVLLIFFFKYSYQCCIQTNYRYNYIYVSQIHMYVQVYIYYIYFFIKTHINVYKLSIYQLLAYIFFIYAFGLFIYYPISQLFTLVCIYVSIYIYSMCFITTNWQHITSHCALGAHNNYIFLLVLKIAPKFSIYRYTYIYVC